MSEVEVIHVITTIQAERLANFDLLQSSSKLFAFALDFQWKHPHEADLSFPVLVVSSEVSYLTYQHVWACGRFAPSKALLMSWEP